MLFTEVVTHNGIASCPVDDEFYNLLKELKDKIDDHGYYGDRSGLVCIVDKILGFITVESTPNENH